MLTLLEVNNAALGVGGMAAKGALVGHLLARDVLRDGLGLVRSAGRCGPDALPGLLGVHVGELELGFLLEIGLLGCSKSMCWSLGFESSRRSRWADGPLHIHELLHIIRPQRRKRRALPGLQHQPSKCKVRNLLHLLHLLMHSRVCCFRHSNPHVQIPSCMSIQHKGGPPRALKGFCAIVGNHHEGGYGLPLSNYCRSKAVPL